MAYVYRHIRKDKNVPFYIGISKKDHANFDRAYNHNPKHRNKFWMAVYSKTEIEVEILFDNVSYDFAKAKEIEFISLYKRRKDGGTLVNITEGGDGVLGLKNPKLAERNKSGVWKGKVHTEETKRRMSLSSIGKKKSPEARMNMSVPRESIKNDRNPNYRGEIAIYKDDELVTVCKSLKEAAAFVGGTMGNISSVLTGKLQLHKGHFFKRISE